MIISENIPFFGGMGSCGVTKKSLFQTIKNKEMDRKDFLKYSGLALITLVGFKAIASLLIQPEGRKVMVESRKESSRGFGSGRYGA